MCCTSTLVFYFYVFSEYICIESEKFYILDFGTKVHVMSPAILSLDLHTQRRRFNHPDSSPCAPRVQILLLSQRHACMRAVGTDGAPEAATLARASALLSYLDSPASASLWDKASSAELEAFRASVMDVHFLPVVAEGPHPLLPWKQSTWIPLKLFLLVLSCWGCDGRSLGCCQLMLE